jgi:hypothetical protein
MTTKASIVVMSHLSDVQIEMQISPKLANERLNFAKFIIIKCKGDLNQEIDAHELWEKYTDSRN